MVIKVEKENYKDDAEKERYLNNYTIRLISPAKIIP